MKLTKYDLKETYSLGISLAHISDTHGVEPDLIIMKVKEMRPDIIAVTGDVFEYVAKDTQLEKKRNINGLRLLKELSKIAPTYLSIGNHDNGGAGSAYLIKNKMVKRNPEIPDSVKIRIKESGCTMLDNSFCSVQVRNKTLLIGGQTSGMSRQDRKPELKWLKDFSDCCGADIKILLCHHPEYCVEYPKEILGDTDIILAGHAHGGQIRVFGKGLYAPCQGLFPKYTSGIHKFGKTKLIISTGLCNTVFFLPRLFNPCEIVEVLM